MQLYWLEGDRQYVRTQTEAIKSKQKWHMDDLALDKDSVIEHLNHLHRQINNEPSPVVSETTTPCPEASPCPECPEIIVPKMPPIFETVAPITDLSAGATLSRMDHPEHNVDKLVELIAISKGQALRRFAGAVAVRFEQLAQKS